MRLACVSGSQLGSRNEVACCADSAQCRGFRNWQKDALHRGPQSLKLSFLVCSSRAWNHWPSGHNVIYWGGVNTFSDIWWQLSFSQWWTLSSGRCFLPAPNCPSLYWSSEHSAVHIYFQSCCAIRPLRKVRCRRKGNLMVCAQLNCVQPFKKVLFSCINIIIIIIENKHSIGFVLKTCL